MSPGNRLLYSGERVAFRADTVGADWVELLNDEDSVRCDDSRAS